MKHDSGACKIDLEKALFDPAGKFSSPDQLLHEASLTKEQKIEILRRWDYDAREESVSAEEGMGEVEGVLLQQIVRALQGLTEELDLDHTPPTKQGGLDRSAVKDRR